MLGKQSIKGYNKYGSLRYPWDVSDKFMAESNEKNTGGGADCTKCGLPISRPGTVTAWIFKASYCACQGTVQDSLAFEFRDDSAREPDLPLLGNRYKVLSPVGRGGVANVYKVQDSVSMNILAAKVMLSELALNDLAVKRFQKETDVLADLSHKNLVKIHGYAMDRNGVPYLIMDYVDGSNLEELVKTDGPIDIESAVNLFVQICAGLIYVHDHGIIHRDLKPSNVIVSRKPGSRADHVTVIDFGFAKNVDGSHDSRLTSTGEAFGSPCYMSPEHCLGKELDVRSDIYSFGCLMYQALCGKPPVEGENALATVAKQVQGDVVSLRKVNPNVPKNLNTVIMQCLQKEPSMRYQTVDEIEQDLIRVQSGKNVITPNRGRTTSASDTQSWSVSSPQIRLNRWVAFAAIIVLVLGSGMIGAWIASNSASQNINAQINQHEIKTQAASAPQPDPVVSIPRLTPRPFASTPRPVVPPRSVFATSPIANPQFKTPLRSAQPHTPIIESTPRIEKKSPLMRTPNAIDLARKELPKKHQIRMEKAREAQKQSEQERVKWLKWLESQKLRKSN